MSKMVSYTDREGSPQIGELQEFMIDIYFTKDRPDNSDRSGYGFAYPANQPATGRGIFFHVRSGYPWMRAYGTTHKLEYLPDFTNLMSSRTNIENPELQKGVRIVGVIGKGAKGSTEIVAWSFPAQYQRALEQCAVYVEFERERIEYDPTFRCVQRRRVQGHPDFEWTVFEGTRRQFKDRFDPSILGKWSSKDPVASRYFGTPPEFTHRFVRETSDSAKWDICEDPATMRFQLTRNTARLMLQFECTRSDNGSPDYPIWHKRNTDEVVAIGSTPKSDQKVVSFPSTPQYARTVFDGKTGEEFWKIGEPDNPNEPFSFERISTRLKNGEESATTPVCNRMVHLVDGITVGDFADNLSIDAQKILHKLLFGGRIMMTIHSVLTPDQQRWVAQQFGYFNFHPVETTAEAHGER